MNKQQKIEEAKIQNRNNSKDNAKIKSYSTEINTI